MKHTLEEIEIKVDEFKQMALNSSGLIMLEIISDLVEEVNLIGKQLEAMSKQALSSIMDNQDLKEENKRLREAREQG